jgi:hypothetical protein
MFLLADNDPQLTVEHEEGLIVTVMDRATGANWPSRSSPRSR